MSNIRTTKQMSDLQVEGLGGVTAAANCLAHVTCFFPLDEGAGTTVSATVGNAVVTPTFIPAWTDGLYADSILMISTTALTSGNFTGVIGDNDFMFCILQAAGDSGQRQFMRVQIGADIGPYIILGGNNYGIAVGINDGTSEVEIEGDPEPQPGAPELWSLCADRDGMGSFYKDGVFVSEADISGLGTLAFAAETCFATIDLYGIAIIEFPEGLPSEQVQIDIMNTLKTEWLLGNKAIPTVLAY